MAVAGPLGHRHQRQPEHVPDPAHERERRLHRRRIGLQEVGVHQRQEAVVPVARLLQVARRASGAPARASGPASRWTATEMSPSPPAATIARVSQSSPESTAKRSGRPRRISITWARSPLASLMPMTLGCSASRRRDRRLEVHRGAAGHVVEADRLGGRVGDRREVAEEAVLGGLVVVGGGGEDVVGAQAAHSPGLGDGAARCRCWWRPPSPGPGRPRSPPPRPPPARARSRRGSAPRRSSRRARGSRSPRRSAIPPARAGRDSPPRPGR